MSLDIEDNLNKLSFELQGMPEFLAYTSKDILILVVEQLEELNSYPKYLDPIKQINSFSNLEEIIRSSFSRIATSGGLKSTELGIASLVNEFGRESWACHMYLVYGDLQLKLDIGFIRNYENRDLIHTASVALFKDSVDEAGGWHSIKTFVASYTNPKFINMPLNRDAEIDIDAYLNQYRVHDEPRFYFQIFES